MYLVILLVLSHLCHLTIDYAVVRVRIVDRTANRIDMRHLHAEWIGVETKIVLRAGAIGNVSICKARWICRGRWYSKSSGRLFGRGSLLLLVLLLLGLGNLLL